MKRWLFRLLLAALLGAAVLWGWHVLFPSPERIVRNKLAELAKTACTPANEAPLARLANVQTLVSFFAPDVEISVDLPGRVRRTINGRDELREAALGARGMAAPFTVEFVDVSVAVGADGQTALAHFTAKGNFPGESVPQVQELKAAFRKRDGAWLVERVETVRTLH